MRTSTRSQREERSKSNHTSLEPRLPEAARAAVPGPLYRHSFADVSVFAPGQALPEPVRTPMEHAFGMDFADVRVHESASPAQIRAWAYTLNDDIHFQPGMYQPGTLEGQELLGHELAHVVQQRRGGFNTSTQVNRDAGLEAEADRAGASAARGEPVHVASSASGVQAKGPDDGKFMYETPVLNAPDLEAEASEDESSDETSSQGMEQSNDNSWGGRFNDFFEQRNARQNALRLQDEGVSEASKEGYEAVVNSGHVNPDEGNVSLASSVEEKIGKQEVSDSEEESDEEYEDFFAARRQRWAQKAAVSNDADEGKIPYSDPALSGESSSEHKSENPEPTLEELIQHFLDQGYDQFFAKENARRELKRLQDLKEPQNREGVKKNYADSSAQIKWGKQEVSDSEEESVEEDSGKESQASPRFRWQGGMASWRGGADDTLESLNTSARASSHLGMEGRSRSNSDTVYSEVDFGQSAPSSQPKKPELSADAKKVHEIMAKRVARIDPPLEPSPGKKAPSPRKKVPLPGKENGKYTRTKENAFGDTQFTDYKGNTLVTPGEREKFHILFPEDSGVKERTKYLSEEERAKYEVKTDDQGRVHQQAYEQSGNDLMDTSNAATPTFAGSAQGRFIVIMDASGKIYAMDSQREMYQPEAILRQEDLKTVKDLLKQKLLKQAEERQMDSGIQQPAFERIHHSTAISGADAAAAGEIEIKNGRIVAISDVSGHYQPSPEMMFQLVQELDSKNALRDTSPDKSDKPMPINKPATIELFGKYVKHGETKDDALKKGITLTSDQFVQTYGNETGIRLKKELNAELDKHPIGVYDDNKMEGIEDHLKKRRAEQRDPAQEKFSDISERFDTLSKRLKDLMGSQPEDMDQQLSNISEHLNALSKRLQDLMSSHPENMDEQLSDMLERLNTIGTMPDQVPDQVLNDSAPLDADDANPSPLENAQIVGSSDNPAPINTDGYDPLPLNLNPRVDISGYDPLPMGSSGTGSSGNNALSQQDLKRGYGVEIPVSNNATKNGYGVPIAVNDPQNNAEAIKRGYGVEIPVNPNASAKQGYGVEFPVGNNALSAHMGYVEGSAPSTDDVGARRRNGYGVPLPVPNPLALQQAANVPLAQLPAPLPVPQPVLPPQPVPAPQPAAPRRGNLISRAINWIKRKLGFH